MKRIALFASGNGSNVEQIILHFSRHKDIFVVLVVSNKPDAYVIKRAHNHSIPSLVLDKNEFTKTETLLEELRKHQVDFIVLAGFLWLIPQYLIRAFQKSIINIHPALLPKYGGKGMYGMNIHRSVINAKERESGITIHYVNEEYDDGEIIIQKTCAIATNETPDTLAKKIQNLEHKHFPIVIESLIIPNKS